MASTRPKQLIFHIDNKTVVIDITPEDAAEISIASIVKLLNKTVGDRSSQDEIIVFAGEKLTKVERLRECLHWHSVAFLHVMPPKDFATWDLRLDASDPFYQRWLAFSVFWMDEVTLGCDETGDPIDISRFTQACEGFSSNQHPAIEILSFLSLTAPQCESISTFLSEYKPNPPRESCSPVQLIVLLYCAVNTGFIELINRIVQIPGFEDRFFKLDDRRPADLALRFTFTRIHDLIQKYISN